MLILAAYFFLADARLRASIAEIVGWVATRPTPTVPIDINNITVQYVDIKLFLNSCRWKENVVFVCSVYSTVAGHDTWCTQTVRIK